MNLSLPTGEMNTDRCEVSSVGPVHGLSAHRHNSIFIIDPNDLGHMFPDLFFAIILVTKDDDLVSNRGLSCGRPIQNDLTFSSRTVDGIGHESLAVVQVRADNGLIR